MMLLIIDSPRVATHFAACLWRDYQPRAVIGPELDQGLTTDGLGARESLFMKMGNDLVV